MSFDPTNPPQRPRSTPIPDGSGSSLPPPTPAQFLSGQSQQLPWTPLAGPDINANVGLGANPVFGAPTRSPFRTVVWIFVLLMLAVTGAIGWFIYDTTRDLREEAEDVFSEQPPLIFETDPSPPITDQTAPGDTSEPTTAVSASPVPAVTVPGTLVVESTALSSITTQATVAEETTTLPTPPPTVLPTPPPTTTLLPNGATSLFAEGAARSVADQLDLGMPGEPTQFTQILMFTDNAVATAQDPASPSQIVAAQWIGGQVQPAEVTSTGGSGDLSTELFTGGDVNWEAISTLVAYAPSVLNLPDGHVTYVSIDRVGSGNPPPVIIELLVEGPSGSGIVRASASGEIIASGPA